MHIIENDVNITYVRQPSLPDNFSIAYVMYIPYEKVLKGDTSWDVGISNHMTS